MEHREPISTVTLRTVRAGLEAEFEISLKEFFQRSRSVPGQLAIHVVKPMPGSGSREWGILRTFSDEKAKEDFFSSALFQEWQAQAAPFMEGERQQQSLSGLETWFTLPGAKAMVPPPRWKMALMSTLGGCTAATCVSLLLGPQVAAFPFLAKTLLMSFCIAALMTYAFMPLLSRLLKGWLYGALPRVDTTKELPK